MKNLFTSIQTLFKSYPSGLYVLLYTEMWELFGRFGITALLVLYLTRTFHLSDARAFTIYSAFLALVYVMPILGGVLCDRLLGNRHSIILGGSIMTAGNLLLVIPHPMSVYLGLSVIILGSGFFLPSIAPLVGQLYGHDRQGRDAGFTLYYLGRNLGALLAPILCGLVAERFGFNYAFILSAIGMFSGLVVFIKGRKHLGQYGYRPVSRTIKLKHDGLIYLGSVCLLPIILFVLIKNIDGYLLLVTGVIVLTILLVIAFRRHPGERRHIFAILILICFFVVFEAFLCQGGTTLNLFIERIVNRKVLGIILPTPFFYAIDPVFMMMIGPILSILWLRLAKRHCEPHSVSKFILALFLLSFGFLIFVFAAHYAIIAGHAPMYYVVIAYFIFPMAELCIVPIGLSMVTRLSPKGLEAMMVGVWMLSSAASRYLTGQISKLGEVTFAMTTVQDVQRASTIYLHVFTFTTITLALAGVVLLLLKPLVQKLIKTV